MELEPCDFLNIFLKFWLFDPHFLINFFLIKKSCSLIGIVNLNDMLRKFYNGNSFCRRTHLQISTEAAFPLIDFNCLNINIEDINVVVWFMFHAHISIL